MQHYTARRQKVTGLSRHSPPSQGPHHKVLTYHDLDFSFADLQIVFVIDIHPLQGTFHPIVSPHKKHYCKSTCRKQSYPIQYKRNFSVLVSNPRPCLHLPSEYSQKREDTPQLPTAPWWQHPLHLCSCRDSSSA